MVMWFHYFQNPDNVPGGFVGVFFTKINTLGQTGVDLFFVLSGFLITRILLSDKESPFYLRDFYIKRSLRIFPLYYFFLVYYLFIDPLLLGKPVPLFSSYWWWLVYLQNIPPTFGISSCGPAHYWSLAIEEHFYLFWPLLVFYCRRRGLMIAAFSMIALSFGMRFIFLTHDWNPFYFTLTRLDALSFGTILALLEPNLRSNIVVDLKFLSLMLVAFVSMTLVAYVFFTGKSYFIIQIVKYPVIAFFYFSLIAIIICSQSESIVCRIFSNKFALYLGGISYGLYVYHGTCFRWFDRLFPKAPILLSIILSFGFTIVVAHISFKIIESPFLQMKKSLLKDGSNKVL